MVRSLPKSERDGGAGEGHVLYLKQDSGVETSFRRPNPNGYTHGWVQHCGSDVFDPCAYVHPWVF